ncbi:MAG: hypothetical protein RJA57_161 [Bacteroidota bacterium]
MRLPSFLFSAVFVLSCLDGPCQRTYEDTLAGHRALYVRTHEVVTGADRTHLRFFPIDPLYRVFARCERLYETPWFDLPTSGTITKSYREYAYLYFRIGDANLRLTVYQSASLLRDSTYRDYLLIPFTDLTSGFLSYDNGRYLDASVPDLERPYVELDFNKAYNPYCAYVTGTYNCPIPPRENDLPVAIRAGEMRFERHH